MRPIFLILCTAMSSCNLTPEQQAGMRAAAASMTESNQQAAYQRQASSDYIHRSSYDEYQNQRMQQNIEDIRRTQLRQQYNSRTSGIPYIPPNYGY